MESIKWQPHNGGTCPVQSGARYDAQHRDGSVTRNRLAYERDRWDHHGTPCDIVAYRLVASRQPTKDAA